MKQLIFIFSILFLLSGCSEDNEKQQENSIFGTWKLVETYGSAGGQGQWTPVENGYTYTFGEDGILISDRFSCEGTYIVDLNNITIDFDCQESQFHLTYGVSFENNNLILTPDPVNCDEGCAEKYQRME